MKIQIDLNKQYSVIWDDDPYFDDNDIFLQGIVHFNNKNDYCYYYLGFSPFEAWIPLKQESFIKFKLKEFKYSDEHKELNLVFFPIERINDDAIFRDQEDYKILSENLVEIIVKK